MITPDDLMSYINLAKTFHKGYVSASLARDERAKMGKELARIYENLELRYDPKELSARINDFKKLWEGKESRLDQLLNQDVPSDEDMVDFESSPLAVVTTLALATPQVIPEWICIMNGNKSQDEVPVSDEPTEPPPDAKRDVSKNDLVVLRYLKKETLVKAAMKRFETLFEMFDKSYPPLKNGLPVPGAPPAHSAPHAAPESAPEPEDHKQNHHPHAPQPPENVGSELRDAEAVPEQVGAAVDDQGPGADLEYSLEEVVAPDSKICVGVEQDTKLTVPLGGAGDMLYFFWNGCELPYQTQFVECKKHLDEAVKEWDFAYEQLEKRVEQETSATMSSSEVEAAMKRHEEAAKQSMEIEAKVDMVLQILTLSDAEIKRRRMNSSGEKVFFAVRDACNSGDSLGVKELCEVMSGEVAIFQWALNVDSRKLSALGYAAQRGNVECVRLLLEASAPVDFGGGGASPIMLAAGSESAAHLEVLQLLFSKSADLNLYAGNTGGALHVAVKARCADNVKFLVENGADVNGGNTTEIKPLYLAMRTITKGFKKLGQLQESKAFDIVDTLLEHHASVDPDWLYELIDDLSLAYSSTDASTTLLSKIVNHVNYLDQRLHSVHLEHKSKGSLLYVAVDAGFVTGVITLVAAGATISHQSCKPKSAPLFLAIAKTTDSKTGKPWDSEALVSELIKANDLDLSARDYRGRTVLLLAVAARKPAVFKILLDRLSTLESQLTQVLDIADIYGRTCVHQAVLTKQPQILDELIACGADVNKQDYQGKTAARQATELSYFAILQKLVSASCDLSKGPSPLGYVRSKYDIEEAEHEVDENINTAHEAEDEDDRMIQIYDLLRSSKSTAEPVAEVVGGGCACVPRRKAIPRK